MNGGGMILIFILFALLVIGGASYSAIDARKRCEERSGLAARLGLAFSPDEDYELAERFGFLDRLAQGSNRYAFNVLSGSYRQNQAVKMGLMIQPLSGLGTFSCLTPG
jgi:flagellar motor component MotA